MSNNLDVKSDQNLSMYMIVSSADVVNRSRSLNAWIEGEIKTALTDAKIDFDEAELKKFVKDNCLIEFKYLNIAFAFKVR